MALISFKQITGLIPYEAMLANKEIKGDRHCPFLRDMDQKEYEVLQGR
jgi:hypothetical protein